MRPASSEEADPDAIELLVGHSLGTREHDLDCEKVVAVWLEQEFAPR